MVKAIVGANWGDEGKGKITAVSYTHLKKVQRIMQKLCFQVTSFTRKSRRYNSYKGNVGKIAPRCV